MKVMHAHTAEGEGKCSRKTNAGGALIPQPGDTGAAGGDSLYLQQQQQQQQQQQHIILVFKLYKFSKCIIIEHSLQQTCEETS